MRGILILMLSLIGLCGYSQESQRISGRVVDSLGQGIVGAVIESSLQGG